MSQQAHSVTGIDSRKLLMWIFLASDCLFFGALISTYLIFKGNIPNPPYPTDRIVNGEFFHGLLNIPLTSVSTFILLMSSVAMVLAVYGSQNNNLKMMKGWLLSTIVLGIVFLLFQVYEFRHFLHEGLGMSTNQFGASFYLMTGLHGVHVGIGVIILISLLFGSFRRNSLGSDTGFHIETAGLYWHFVDIVWIVIFTLVYLMPY
jgi:heme/copper-type cytochrome/quinol oxidase subunit 3